MTTIFISRKNQHLSHLLKFQVSNFFLKYWFKGKSNYWHAWGASMLLNPALDLHRGFQNNMSLIKQVVGAKAREDPTVERARFLSAPSSQGGLLPPPFLTGFLFFHPSIFRFIVSWRDACKESILPSMALLEIQITISNNYWKWRKIIGCFSQRE